LLVEQGNGQVQICATKDTFSPLRKINFTHHLASEGFIPDHYRWVSNLDSASPDLSWRVDHSWLKARQTTHSHTTKIMVALLASAVALWMGLMLALFQGWI
jgi:hypothetical protein